MLGRLYRKFVKYPVESFNLNFGEGFFNLLVLCIAYTRVVFQRSKLYFGAEFFAASSNKFESVRNYRYHRSLDALGWAKHWQLSNGYHLRQFPKSPEQNNVYLDTAAQVLLLNNVNTATFGHSFHVLSPSPLPVSFSLSLGSVVVTILLALRGTLHDTWYFNLFGFCAIMLLGSILVMWILLVAREEYSGAHTLEVQQSFRIGIVLFIASEFMLFVAFFWAFFHFALNPSAFTGCHFVPEGLIPFFWYRIPLVNTVILLSSGMSLTLAHFWLAQSDNNLRARGWLQALVQGTFLTQNPEKEFIEYCDAALLTRTNQEAWHIIHNTYPNTTPSYSLNRWGIEWREATAFNNGPWELPPSLARNNAGYCRLYDRVTDYTGKYDFPLFRWADDVRVYNAMAYAFAVLHHAHVGTTDGDAYPTRTTRRVLPMAFRAEFDSPLAPYYEKRNAYRLFHQNPFLWLADTIVRGLVFLTLQAYEYITGLFTISDSVFGATFYTLTGLHGLHVFVGVLMLMAAWWYNRHTAITHMSSYRIDNELWKAGFPLEPRERDIFTEFGEFYHGLSADMVRSGHFVSRLRNNRFFNWWRHRVAFDGVAWYWHFVDVVWLFVFIFVYWYAFPTNINVIAK